MKTMLRILLLAVGMAASGAGHAALSCVFQSIPNINFVSYTPNTTYLTSSNALRQVQATALCTRTADTDPTTVWLGAANGINAQGHANYLRQTFGATNYNIAYDLYKNSACNVVFRDANTNSRVAASIPSAPLNTQHQVTFDFYACITTAQALTGYPAGTYSDTLTFSVRDGNTALASSTVNVSLFAPAVCSISNGPGNIVFTYSGFGSAQFESTFFNANCTNGLPYTLSVAPAGGTVGGLRYGLGITALTPGTTPATGPFTYTDTGNPTGTRLYYINGYMDPLQAGQVGAPTSQPHTVTLTY